MSRILAYVGAPIDVASLVFGGDHSLRDQSWRPREMLRGALNAEGHGVAWYAAAEPARLSGSGPLWREEQLEGTLRAIRAPVVLAALGTSRPERGSGSPGAAGAAVPPGLLPLTRGRWSFALDGWVPDFQTAHMRALRATLPDHLYAALRGASEAETLFLLALARIEEGAGMVEGMTGAARAVSERVGRAEAQLNMVMTDGRSLAAIRAGTALVTNSMYVAEHPPFAPEGVVLASEPPERGAVWAPVDGHSSIEIDGDGRVTSELLFLD